MKDKVNVIKKEYEEKKSSITSIKTLNDVRVEYLGKQGKITELSKMMKDVPNDQKKEFGMLVNEVRNFVTETLDEIKEKLEKEALNKKLESEKIDITLPGTKVPSGSANILERIIAEKFIRLFGKQDNLFENAIQLKHITDKGERIYTISRLQLEEWGKGIIYSSIDSKLL